MENPLSLSMQQKPALCTMPTTVLLDGFCDNEAANMAVGYPFGRINRIVTVNGHVVRGDEMIAGEIVRFFFLVT